MVIVNDTRAPTDENIRDEVLKAYQNGEKPKALSDRTGISINTIKSWIKRDKSKSSALSPDAPNKKRGAPAKNKKGAPVGNKNAKGYGAPSRNKNAEKHGAYSKIYWDALDEEELQLMQDIPTGEEYQLKQQIAMYTVRERRLMHQIQEFRDKAQKGLYIKSIKKKKHAVYDENGKKSDSYEDTNTDTEYAVKALMTLESELTKVQRAKTKCIDSLIRLRTIEERHDDLLNGWQTKAEAAVQEEAAEEVSIYLPDNGRGL